jgi:hypothetical protein
MTPESEKLLMFLCRDPETCVPTHGADCLLYRGEMRERLEAIEAAARTPLVEGLHSVYSVHGPSGLDCECKGCVWYREDADARAESTLILHDHPDDPAACRCLVEI